LNYELIINLIGTGSALLIITLIFWFTNLDIYFESFFYNERKGWFLKDHKLMKFLYKYGRAPGAIVFLISLLILILGLFIPLFARYRKISLYLFLYMFIGSGIIINSILKIYWGRPRPKQIKKFGGKYDYVNVFMFGKAGRNSSFPCGHASIAFYMIFPYFLLKSTNPTQALIFLLIGISFGLLVGIGRMVQGGHFASDVVWAGGIMYLTGLILYYLMNLNIGGLI